MTDVVNARWWHHGNFYYSLPGGVPAHHGLFRARAFETLSTFHVVAKRHRTLSAVVHSNNQKTSPSHLLMNTDVTPSVSILHVGYLNSATFFFCSLSIKLVPLLIGINVYDDQDGFRHKSVIIRHADMEKLIYVYSRKSDNFKSQLPTGNLS